MPNAYGTKEYDAYIEKYRRYLDGYPLIKTERNEECFEKRGIHFNIIRIDHDAYISEDAPYPEAHAVESEITVTLKNGQIETYNTVECTAQPQVFTYCGVDYIFMTKTLYGYCIINTKKFEEYNYFPSAVLKDGKEAFICCEIYSLKDLLIIEGCYWACPYEYYVLDIESKKAIRLYDHAGQLSSENEELCDSEIKLYENSFGVVYAEGNKECLFDYDDLKQWIQKEGNADF